MVPLTNADHPARLFGALPTTARERDFPVFTHWRQSAPDKLCGPRKGRFAF